MKKKNRDQVRFLFRPGPRVHRLIAMRAKAEGVSINEYIVRSIEQKVATKNLLEAQEAFAIAFGLVKK